MSRSMEWPVSSVVPLSGTEGRTHSDCSWESVRHHWHLPKARTDYSSRSIGLQHSSHSEREASRRCLNGTVSIQQEARAPRDGQRLQKGLSPPLEASSVPPSVGMNRSTKCGTRQAKKRIWIGLGVTWICCSEAIILDTGEWFQECVEPSAEGEIWGKLGHCRCLGLEMSNPCGTYFWQQGSM